MNYYLRSYTRGDDSKAIALTFDDGPGSETAAILDILKEQSVPAAFFSIGKNVTAERELVKRIDAEGHIVGNHSYNHGVSFDWLTATRMEQELIQTNEVIKSTIGKEPKLFRPPYGVTNPNLAKAVKRTGMYSIGWSVRSFDTTTKSSAFLVGRILNSIKGGDIVLLHDTMPLTREILIELIMRIRQKGFIFVRVDKLLDINAYA